jgi:hypothetical protein
MAKEQDVLRLPFRITEFNEDMLVALDRNFKEIEDRLSTLQLLMKSISGGSINDIVDTVLLIKNNALAALANAAAAQETADGQIQGFFQNEAPEEGMGFGDIWIDIDGHTPPTVNDIYRYEDVDHGSGGDYDWRSAPTNAIGKIYLNAYLAQTTANSKIKTYYQETAPSGDLTEGDYWIDTSDHNKPYRWNGTEWQDARDTASSAVGMAAGLTCTGLWHFDGTLNNQKGTAAVTDGAFLTGKWGQGLEVATGKTLKIPSEDILYPGESSVNFRVYNLSESPNDSILLDIGDDAGNQAIKAGIANDGKLFIEDKRVQLYVLEDDAADYATGTLSDVVAGEDGIELEGSGTDLSVVEDTAAEFGQGTLLDVEVADDKLQLEFTEGAIVYGSNISGNSAATADTFASGYPAANTNDGSTSTQWRVDNLSYPHYLKYNFGVGVTKVIRKLRIYTPVYIYMNDFDFQGSNNDSSWDTIYSGVCTADNGWNEFTFENSVAYRYYRIYFKTGRDGAFVKSARVNEVQLMEATQEPGYYASSGYREQEYDLSSVGTAKDSVISWSATTPANTSVAVQAAVALDGVNYGSYQTCTSGSAIPGITAGADLSSAKLKIKTILATTDDSATPSVSQISIAVTSAYKASGSWQKIYDISPVGSADSHAISWSWLRPTNTTQIVKAALSTDNGATYGSFVNCTSGQPIPVLTDGMDISSARLKIQVDLSTTNGAVTPKVYNLSVQVAEENNVAYGINKSDLTDWDDIAIQWKTERLSLLANGVEIAYIENPGLVTVFGDYAYIGCDKLGANQIGTIIDELRIDNAYIDIENVNKWNLMDSPFYTSEEMKQWPGYVKIETEGLKVYDSEDVMRLLVGSWLNGVVRKYGIKIINGEIYSSLVSTGEENAKTYIRLVNPNLLQMYSEVGGVAKKQLELAAASGGGGGGIDFYVDDNWVGSVGGQDSDLYIGAPYGDVILTSLNVLGTKNCVEITSVGKVGISARESPEVRYIDEGIGVLTNGVCRIDIDPIFLEVTEPNAVKRWIIQVTPYADIGLYISEIGDGYFIVKERQEGLTTGAEFSWSLSAARKGYSDIRFKQIGKPPQ